MAKKLTPMMKQYHELKVQYPNEILFFRLGDFYEMFYDDAELVSRELELTLTGRAAGNNERAPMCGVPYHSATPYIFRLIQKGYRVAICEQMEDPREVKGLVKRDVVKIITPGTILLEDCMQESMRNYLAYIYQEDKKIAVSMAEVSTGECRWGLFAEESVNDLLDVLSVYSPTEIIIHTSAETAKKIREYANARLGATLITDAESITEMNAGEQKLGGINQDELPADVTVRRCLELLFVFLADVLKNEAKHITVLLPIREENRMILDNTCLRHLEIVKNLRDGTRKGTLLELLDNTVTAMGGRLLSRWLEAPLTDINAIVLRQDAIADLLTNARKKDELRELLSVIFDFERILTRVEMNSASPKDLLALSESLQQLPEIKENVQSFTSRLLKSLSKNISIHAGTCELLCSAIAENAGLQRDGNYIKDGFSKELDELRSLVHDNREWIRKLEEEEKEKTGLKLKIGFNNVFGYYFEIPNSNTKPIPEYFVRKQTLTNAERFITPELKEFEVKVLHAQEEIECLEIRLFQELKKDILPHIADIQKTARQIAELDCLASLAQAASENRYTRPYINNSHTIQISDGRHPMLDVAMKTEVFVPNDTNLSHDTCETMLITGPNMAGKSTYMRQVAVLVLMAQIGSYIPAREASIGPVDRIFTRIGASDDISTGQSTFMVEMREVAHILKYATKNSLVLLDEIGRGTSTYDGMSIAKAVIEYMTDHIHAFTLFATHYHELTDIADDYSGIQNYTVAVKESKHGIRFLRRIVPGRANRSYGIHVAELAGLPSEILRKSEQILASLETANPSPKASNKAVIAEDKSTAQSDLFTMSIWDELAEIDVMSLTPIEAMEILFRLNKDAKERKGI